MIVQAYFDNKPLIRLFKHHGQTAIAELPLSNPDEQSARKSLSDMNLRRTSKWIVTEWGREATVQFK